MYQIQIQAYQALNCCVVSLHVQDLSSGSPETIRLDAKQDLLPVDGLGVVDPADLFAMQVRDMLVKMLSDW